MAVYDLIFGLILICISILFCYRSVMLARPRGWLTAPGLPPLLIHSSLGFMGLILLIGSLRRQGLIQIKENLKAFDFGVSVQQIFLKNKTFLLIFTFFVYFIIFVRILPFELSTFIYLFTIFKIFWKRSFSIAIITSILTTAAFTLVFTKIFKVMLPGMAWGDFLPFLF